MANRRYFQVGTKLFVFVQYFNFTASRKNLSMHSREHWCHVQRPISTRLNSAKDLNLNHIRFIFYPTFAFIHFVFGPYLYLYLAHICICIFVFGPYLYLYLFHTCIHICIWPILQKKKEYLSRHLWCTESNLGWACICICNYILPIFVFVFAIIFCSYLYLYLQLNSAHICICIWSI